MRRLLLIPFIASSALGVVTLMPGPVRAQQADRIIDIYGNDRCPASNGQQIVVCRNHPETERFRIPKDLRDQEREPQAAGGNIGAVTAVNTTGQTGVQINSCNTIGAGVNAGCTKQGLDAWKAQQRAQKKQEEGVP
jgi:hypothetical protein